MEHKTQDYSISVKRNQVVFTGKITEFDSSLKDFLEVILLVNSRPTFDFTALHYLNAMCIATLARIIEDCPQYIRVKINKSYSWQQPAVSALSIIKPGGIKVV